MTPAVHGQRDDSGNVFILLLIPPCGVCILMLLSTADKLTSLSCHASCSKGSMWEEAVCPASSAAAGLSRTDNPLCELAALPC